MQKYYLSPSYASAAPGEAEALDLLMRAAASGSVSRIYKSSSSKGSRLRVPAAGIRTLASIRAGSASTPSPPRAFRPTTSTLAISPSIEDLRETGITQEELDRARASYLAEFVYTSDSQSRMARQYGWRLSTGMTIEDVEDWPERLKRVTVDDVRDAARKYLVDKNSVTGYLLPAPEYTAQHW